jgi:hypothetical protein
VCSLATATGRITLSGMKLVETEKRFRRERALSGEGEWETILRDRFGIERAR